MCLAIPGQIVESWVEDSGAPFARVDFAGDVRRVSLAFLPELTVGDYVIVHAGFALTAVPPENVEQVMESIREAGLLETSVSSVSSVNDNGGGGVQGSADELSAASLADELSAMRDFEEAAA